MQFVERIDGNYRIYAGALELREGRGFIAAVVVQQLVDGRLGGPREIYRDTGLSCNYPWASSDMALARALDSGASAVRLEQHRP